MAKKFPTLPQHPERVCWGCDLFCVAKDMRCGNGSDRTPHPVELFGADWREWGESEKTETAAQASNAKFDSCFSADQ